MNPAELARRVVSTRDRREILGYGLAGALGGALLAGVAVSRQGPPQKLIADHFGIGDSPVNGGSTNIELAIKDLKALGAGGVKLIDPRDEILQAVLEAGIKPSFRTYMKSDVVDHKLVYEQLERVRKFKLSGPVVQWYCEPNNRGEVSNPTGEISPERHIAEFFWPLAEVGAKVGIRSVITPPDQMKEGEKDFFERQIRQVIKMAPNLDWIRRNLLIGVHVYTLGPNDNPWDRLLELERRVARAFGVNDPGVGWIVAEVGRFRHRKYAVVEEEDFSRDTLAILKRPVPVVSATGKPFNVEELYFWIAANKDQRLPGDRNPPEESIVHDFELQAWRSSQMPKGVRPIYEDWRRYNGARKAGA